jgi:hypothetical protein
VISSGGEIAWYENDGNENFTTRIITTNVVQSFSVYAVDVDSDEDIDVLATSLGNYVVWYENDGNENFTDHIITSDVLSPLSVFAIDVDNDTDIDVLSASYWDDKIAWYENIGIVSVDEISSDTPTEYILSQNYPNPFNPITTINYQIPEVSFVTIKVYDVLGNEIATLVNEEKPAGSYEIEFSATGGSASGGDAYNLTSGIYFYQLHAGDPSSSSGQDYIETKKMVIIK